jgi:hypothetical protein
MDFSIFCDWFPILYASIALRLQAKLTKSFFKWNDCLVPLGLFQKPEG